MRTQRNDDAPFGRTVRRSIHERALLPAGSSQRSTDVGARSLTGSARGPAAPTAVNGAARAVAAAPGRELEADAAYLKIARCRSCEINHRGEC